MRKMLIITLLVLIVEFGQRTAGLSNPILLDIQDIKSWAHDVGDIASGVVSLEGLSTGQTDPTQAKLDGLSKQIEERSASINLEQDNALSEILTTVPQGTDFAERINQLDGFMARINELFEDYQEISESSSDFDEYSAKQFVETATSMHDGDVIETLNEMHKWYMGSQDDDAQESLMSEAASVFTNMDRSSLCGWTESRQQRVYDLYRTVAITEVKGFLMTAYAYGILGIYRKTTFKEKIKTAEENLITRISDYLRVTKEGLVSVPRDVYACDPAKHRADTTFVDLSRAVQLVVVPEDKMDGNSNSFSCSQECNTIYSSRSYKSNEPDQPRTVCKGTMADCLSIDESEICELDGDVNDSIERTVYVKSDELGEFGDSDRCALTEKRQVSGYTSNIRYCDMCLCVCVEEKSTSTAIRAFSLRPQVTDIENNMVLTGISFEKQDNLIQLQIEQGKLMADGRIEEDSQELVTLEKFDYIPDRGNQGGFDVWVNQERQDAVDKEDFVFINYKRRKIHLDDIVADSTGYVVTGAKLKVSSSDVNAIALSVRLTMFNFTSGKLHLEKNLPSGTDNAETKVESIWVDGDTGAGQKGRKDRTVIDVKNKKDPSKSSNNIPSSEDYSKITITHSSDRDDVGQSTIPYFDKIRSGPMPRVALDGLGLYHRSNGESGGFIGIKTFTHDLSQYLNSEI